MGLSLSQKYNAITEVESKAFSMLYGRTLQRNNKQRQIHFSHRYKLAKMNHFF